MVSWWGSCVVLIIHLAGWRWARQWQPQCNSAALTVTCCGWSFEKSFQVLIAKLWMHHSVDGRVAAQVAKWFPWAKNWDPRFAWVIITFTVKSVDLWGMRHFWITKYQKHSKTFKNSFGVSFTAWCRISFIHFGAPKFSKQWPKNGVAPHLN